MSATKIFERCAEPELMSESGCRPTPAFALHAPPINQMHRNVLLPQGRAMTFVPREDTQLRLTEGRLWITFEAPPNGLAPRNGDHFVAAGDRFDMLAGEAAVFEAIGSEPAALFDLEPALSLPRRAVAQVRANLGPAMARALRGVRRLIGARTATS